MHSVEDARRAARRRLPRMIFDFVDGGADREVTLRANCADFDRVQFRPRSLVDVRDPQTATDLFGHRLALPLLLSPAGLAGVVGGGGERAIARAAKEAGTKLILSTQSNASIEEVTEVAPDGVWFQLYPWRDPATVDSLVDRAASSGCAVLVITVDVPTVGNRLRDLHNGAVLPPRPSLGSALDFGRHPRWMRQVLSGPRLRFGNLSNLASNDDLSVIGEYVTKHLVEPSATWDFVERVRRRWSGRLVVKGLLTGADASRAVASGADGVVVSNHGGRQLDGAPSTISSLPEVVDAVGAYSTVLLDGGVRSGADLARALALGARACLVGRPYLWGAAVAGEEGVARVIAIFAEELRRTLALLGCRTVGELCDDFVDTPAEWSARRAERM